MTSPQPPRPRGATTRPPRDRRNLVVLGACVLTVAVWQAASWAHDQIAGPPHVTRQSLPVHPTQPKVSDQVWHVDTTRPATLITERRLWTSQRVVLEVPVVAGTPTGRLPERVDLTAALTYDGFSWACQPPKQHPGTILYPERVVALDCGTAVPDSPHEIVTY